METAKRNPPDPNGPRAPRNFGRERCRVFTRLRVAPCAEPLCLRRLNWKVNVRNARRICTRANNVDGLTRERASSVSSQFRKGFPERMSGISVPAFPPKKLLNGTRVRPIRSPALETPLTPCSRNSFLSFPSHLLYSELSWQPSPLALADWFAVASLFYQWYTSDKLDLYLLDATASWRDNEPGPNSKFL